MYREQRRGTRNGGRERGKRETKKDKKEWKLMRKGGDTKTLLT